MRRSWRKDETKKKKPEEDEDPAEEKHSDEDEDEGSRGRTRSRPPRSNGSSHPAAPTNTTKGKRSSTQRSGRHSPTTPPSPPSHDSRNRASSHSSSSGSVASAVTFAEEDSDSDPDDKDDFRRQNRFASHSSSSSSSSHSSSVTPAIEEQRLAWHQFRAKLFPVTTREITNPTLALSLRKALLKKSELIHRHGIPVALRRGVWEIVAGAKTFPERLEFPKRYEYYGSQKTVPSVGKNIASDVSRAMGGHAKFSFKSGQQELTHVLSAFSIRFPSIGYCNSLAHVAAFLLLFYPEERAFWMLCALVEIILPADYFTNSLLGVRADAQLIKILVYERLPKLHRHLSSFGIDTYVYVLKQLMSIFILALPIHVVIRLFDCFWLEGNNFLVSTSLALFHLHQSSILALKSQDEVLEYMSKTITASPLNLDVDAILKLVYSSKCKLDEKDLEKRARELFVMTHEYQKELQVGQKYQAQLLEQKKKEDEEKREREEEEEKTLQWGVEMWKIGKTGGAKKKKIYLQREEGAGGGNGEKKEGGGVGRWVVSWDSKKSKMQSRMFLRDCSFYYGLKYGQFLARADMKKQFRYTSHLAFTLLSPVRTLDIVCLSQYDFDTWASVLERTDIKELEKLDKCALREEAWKNLVAEAKAKGKPIPKRPEEERAKKDREEEDNKQKEKDRERRQRQDAAANWKSSASSAAAGGGKDEDGGERKTGRLTTSERRAKRAQAKEREDEDAEAFLESFNGVDI